MRAFGIMMSLVFAAPSLACWSGIDASGERVRIDALDDGAIWSPALAQRYANGIRQIEALLPSAASIEVRFDKVTLCQKDRCQMLARPWRDGNLDTLFGMVADTLETQPRDRERAAGLTAPLWTIEVLKTGDPRAARATQKKLVRDGQADPGFLEAGGSADVTDATHLRIVGSTWSVRVGAFLTRAEAVEAAEMFGPTARIRRL